MKIIATYTTGSDADSLRHRILVWPDSAMIRSHKPLFLSLDETYFIHPALGVKIDAVGKSIATKFARRYYNQIAPMAFMLPKRASDILSEGNDPNGCDIVADYSVICGDFTEAQALGDYWRCVISLRSLIDSSQSILKEEMEGRRSNIDEAVAYSSLRNTLKTGDLVATLTDFRMEASPETLIKFQLNDSFLLENKLK